MVHHIKYGTAIHHIKHGSDGTPIHHIKHSTPYKTWYTNTCTI
jgi:hypothetical protein